MTEFKIDPKVKLLPQDAHLAPWLPPYRGKIDTSDPNYMKLSNERDVKRKEAMAAYHRAVAMAAVEESGQVVCPAPDRERDPDRIQHVLRLIEVYWQDNPDLRLGQMVVNALGMKDPELFYMEDDVFVGHWEKMMSKENERKLLDGDQDIPTAD